MNWPLLLAAMAGLSFGAIPTATLGVFMQPLQEEFGWTRATISMGLTVFAILTTPLAPFAGALIDKFGARPVAIPGVALCGLSFAAFSLLDGSVARWIAIWVAYSLAALLIRSMVWNRAVSAVFETSRGLAIAVLLSGMSLAGAFAPMLTHVLIANFGWAGAYLGVGFGWAGIAWILVILFFREGNGHLEAPGISDATVDRRRSPGGLTVKQALRNAPLLRIALAVLFQTTFSAAFSVHLVPIHSSLGATRGEAVSLAVFMGVGAIAGKLLTGWIADRVNSGFLPLTAFSLPALGYLLLIIGDGSLLALSAGTFIIGTGSGAAIHMAMYLTTQYGGLLNFGKIFGSISALMGLAGGIGPLVAGLIYDATDSYVLFITAAIPVLLVAGATLFGLGPYPNFEAQEAELNA